MGPSRTVAVVAHRSRAAEGLLAWRATIGTAFAVVISRPELWLIGALSVTARGGLLLLTLPLLTLPSPVAFSVILGPELVAGDSPALGGLIAAAAAVLGALVVAGLVLGAVADLMAYERFVRDPESAEVRHGRAPGPMNSRRRMSTVVSLVAVQVTALVPAVVAAAWLGERLSVLIRAELMHPSSDGQLLARITSGAREPLVALIVLLLLAEIVGSLATRHLLASRFGIGDGPRDATEARSVGTAVVRVVAAPVVLAVRAAGGWLLAALLFVPVAGALLVAWDAMRALYLTPAALDADVAVARTLVTVVFAALWVVAIVMAGVASAIRAAHWTATSLR
jgi:hypothetical protein